MTEDIFSSGLCDIVLSEEEKDELRSQAKKKLGVKEDFHLIIFYSLDYLDTYMENIKLSGEQSLVKSHIVENAVMEMAFRYYVDTISDSLEKTCSAKRFFALDKVHGLGLTEEGFYGYLRKVTGYDPIEKNLKKAPRELHASSV